MVLLLRECFRIFFNRKENANYIGPMPDLQYYGVESMSVKERENFMRWYEGQRGEVFDMRKDIVTYCKSDVTILRRACAKFRKLFKDVTTVDIFRECVNIASGCMQTFRKNFLRPETIGLIPPGGYGASDKQSRSALLWLDFVAKERNIKIQHTKNLKEHRVGRFKVDGYCEELNLCFEYNGCYFHGCPRCFPRERHTAFRDKQCEMLEQRYERTLARQERLESLGYRVEVLWECEFKHMIKTNARLADFVKQNFYKTEVESINPRDAFFGGRTNCTKRYVNAQNGSKILYQDFTSLYPHCCKSFPLPKGHPKIYYGNDCPDISSFDGLVKCVILPPENLYHPVLPVRKHGKLLFPLCNACSDMSNEERGAPLECPHSDEQRALKGTWVSFEVREAVKRGYQIMHYISVWAYEMTQGLLSSYINLFYKIKTESTGYPQWCTDDASKAEFIKNFKEREDIDLDPEKMKPNAGLRALAKLCLNSLWGKFAQRQDLQQCTIVTDSLHLNNLLTNPNINVQTVFPLF